jgi:hypothetical protein
VPVNQTPTASPTPLGPQTPDRPPEARHPTARESIQRAFERANNPQRREAKPERAAPPPAEAKKGHNQPPEDTPTINLRKRPSGPVADGQPRGDGGRFAPRQPSDENVPQQNPSPGAPGQAQPARVHAQLPEGAPYREPPQRMADVAKADWATVPETVRGDVHRMHHEFGEAYKRYRGDNEVMNSIRPFQDLARKHGTTLQKALTNYVNMETKLRADPVAGLDTIVSNLNLQGPDGRKITLRDVAYHILSQSPEQHQLMQTRNGQNAAAHQIGALHQEIEGLKNTLQQMHTQQQFTYTRSAVDQFADSHPRFDELGDLIENELKLGFDLDTAYRRAELLRPSTHAAQTRTTPAQTRPADRSIHGAPDGPSNGTSRPKAASKTPHDAVQRAFNTLAGRH